MLTRKTIELTASWSKLSVLAIGGSTIDGAALQLLGEWVTQVIVSSLF